MVSYRWLDFERFLEITEQEHHSWKMIPIDYEIWEKNKLSEPVLVRKLQKERVFQ